MKKVTFLCAIALMGLLSSCKKDWTCECTLSYGSISTKRAFPLTNQTKSSATTNCDAMKTNFSNMTSVGYSTNCELK